MASTKYQVQSLNDAGEFEPRELRSEKNAAVALAAKIRTDEKVTTQVITLPASGDMTKSKIIAEYKAGKRVRRSEVWAKPYTRTDERVTAVAPTGWEAAYFRPRRDAVTLRRRVVVDAETGREGWEYAIARPSGVILRAGIATTEACSRYLANVTKTEDLNVAK